MDFVLIYLLILDSLSTGQSNNLVAIDICYERCEPGKYSAGQCSDSTALHKCQRCPDGTYTEINNTALQCHRCDTCNNDEKIAKHCSLTSNVVCDCQDGYYDANANPNNKECQRCPCTNCDELKDRGSKKKCQACKKEAFSECQRNTDCMKKCREYFLSTNRTTFTTTISSASPSATTTQTSPVTLKGKTTSTKAPSSPSYTNMAPPQDNETHFHWLILAGVVIFLTGVMLLLQKMMIVKKTLEPPVEVTKFHEQCCHQGNSPTMLTLTMPEEPPMWPQSQSPSTSENGASSPLLPDEHKAVRQDEQSERWPAIVLYAIIKEVPLRRWKEFLRLLSVADQQLERVELEAGLGSIERQYQMLRLWSQRTTASLGDIFSALHYMDLSGCAQLLNESLEKLNWTPFTDHGFNGAMQDT